MLYAIRTTEAIGQSLVLGMTSTTNPAAGTGEKLDSVLCCLCVCVRVCWGVCASVLAWMFKVCWCVCTCVLGCVCACVLVCVRGPQIHNSSHGTQECHWHTGQSKRSAAGNSRTIISTDLMF